MTETAEKKPLTFIEKIWERDRDATIKWFKEKPLRKLAQITCKNEGCKERRRNGSQFCQLCSDKHHGNTK